MTPTRIARVLSGAIAGALTGGALVFITIDALGAASWQSGNEVSIPGFFWVSAGSPGGSPDLSFIPNFVGMALMVACFAVIPAVATGARWKRMRPEGLGPVAEL